MSRRTHRKEDVDGRQRYTAWDSTLCLTPTGGYYLVLKRLTSDVRPYYTLTDYRRVVSVSVGEGYSPIEYDLQESARTCSGTKPLEEVPIKYQYLEFPLNSSFPLRKSSLTRLCRRDWNSRRSDKAQVINWVELYTRMSKKAYPIFFESDLVNLCHRQIYRGMDPGQGWHNSWGGQRVFHPKWGELQDARKVWKTFGHCRNI